MLVLVTTLLATLAPAPPAADSACDVDDDACVAAADAGDPQPSDDAYATPAVVDCRSATTPTAAPLDLATFVGECDGTIYDLSYRASRTPDSEQVTRAFLPASRERHRAVSSCGGLPPRGPELSLSDTPPLALAETSRPVLDWTRAPRPGDALELTSLFGDPPDRPPRV